MSNVMSNVEKMTIALTPEMAGFIRDSVDAGRYASTSEAVREEVREWQARRDLLGYSIEELRALVQEGLDEGDPLEADDVFSDIREVLRLKADRR